MSSKTMDNVADQGAQVKLGLLARLKRGLAKTRQGFSEQVSTLFLGAKAIDETLLEAIETLLITSDFGMPVTTEIIDDLTKAVARDKLSDPAALKAALRTQLLALLSPSSNPFTLSAEATEVILMVG